MGRTIEDQHTARQRLRLWLQMLKATRHVEVELRNKLRENFETTLPRFDVLATLLAHPEGMKMSDLSQQLVVSNGNVTDIVSRLAKDGYVARTTSKADRRASLVKITPKGHEFTTRLTTDHLGWINDIFEHVTDPDAARGISIMLDIRQNTKRTADKA